jgi:hypothetical protein
MHIGEVFLHDTVCIKAIHSCSTARPHVVHQLSGDAVNKLCVSFLLQRGNDPRMRWSGLFGMAFLPTMKLQPSQLPMIVGSGRVAIRRALFSCARLSHPII